MAAGEYEGSSLEYNYDVFFSSSPRDVCTTNQLYKALVNAGFRIIRDGDLIVRSADIKSEVNELIHRSKISVVVLSKSYVSSRWCLDQLVMIIQAKKTLILPVFYDVAPSEVGEAFSRFEDQESDPEIRNNMMNKMNEWSEAAADVREFSFPNQAQGDESSLIKEFIEVVEEKVKSVEEDSAQMEIGTSLRDFLNQESPSSLAEDWTAAEISLTNIEELPENPNCPFMVKLLFQESNDLMEIPDSFFESMPHLEVLDLSNTSIKTLPRSIASLGKLRELYLRSCVLLTELPPEIEELRSLKVFDLEGTELVYLPNEIGWLFKLECLKFSLHKCSDKFIERKGIDAIIPRGTLSRFSLLTELSIVVDPDCEWWDEELKVVIEELSWLRNLNTLKLYFPTLALLQQFMQHQKTPYWVLSNFLLTVGRHEHHIISSLPRELENSFQKIEKCLIYVNGKGNPDGIGDALSGARALFLDRQWTVKNLTELTIDSLEFCLVVECNEMNTIVDGNDYNQEGDNGILLFLRYLSVHYMKNLQSIWRGPFVSLSLSNLEILALHTCPELTTVINPDLLYNLIFLRELIVENCPKVKSLVSGDLSGLESDSYFLRALEKILLVDLLELVSISGGLRIGPKLERIVFFNCPMLKDLSPMDNMYSRYMHEITGDESEWLNAVESSNGEISYLQDELSYESAKKIILHWDSTTSHEAKEHMNRMIFDSDPKEVDQYLQAVDNLLQLMESTRSAEYRMKAKSMTRIAMAHLEDEFRNILITRAIIDGASIYYEILQDDDYTDDDLMSKVGDYFSESATNSSYVSSYRSSPNTMREPNLMAPEAINDLRSIAERMISAGYIRECVQVYCSVRESAVDSSFRSLVVEKLGDGDVQKLEWEVLQMKIRRWIRAAKVCVRILFAGEKKLCEKIFEGVGTTTIYDACFMETVKGPLNYLFNFAEAISVIPPAPDKLFRILDLHKALSDLMPHIGYVFNSKSLESVLVQARKIQSHLAETSRVILSEFENLVLHQPSRVPVAGGSIPPLTRYVMNYIILIADYKQTLLELIVSKPQTDMNFEEDQQSSNFALHLIWIIMILQSNLEEKSKLYKDASLANLFIMNNVRYIVQKIKGSPELREMIGENYFRKLSEKYNEAATGYMSSTWMRVLSCLRDEVHKTQAMWLVPNTELREELRTFISHKLIPTYTSSLDRVKRYVDIETHQRDYSIIDYSVKDLEKALLDLFEGIHVRQHNKAK